MNEDDQRTPFTKLMTWVVLAIFGYMIWSGAKPDALSSFSPAPAGVPVSCDRFAVRC